MELVELKSIWKKANMLQTADHEVSAEEVHRLIKKRSNTAISRIKREMRFKIWFMGIIGVVGMVMSPLMLILDVEDLPLDGILSRVEISILYFLMSAIIFTFSRLIKDTHDKISNYQNSSSDLKTAIEEIIQLMHRIMKLAVKIGARMSTAIIIWIAYAVLYKNDPFAFDLRILYLIAIAAVSYKLLSLLETWVQERKYGKYVKILKECRDELEVVNNDSE
ncbi:hypothetical protein GWK08_01020 [Leptobacterium flavescens]|uniref:Uncharacterized protein n=1 Tax=Leptobacterium flavescens TaxID=472055 RepID=A0A6P0UJH1_9FLAO|nr:hypothetical protein [Leptobacterium flavescens]NER12009.1 hypothetical protein [Leptobacterium flavescens]